MHSLFGEFAKPDNAMLEARELRKQQGGRETMISTEKGAPFSTFVANLLDDLLIFSETWESHMEHLTHRRFH